MEPKVSIVLPVYNVEKYISKSIESILNQNFTNFELLIIDDGSPDKSIQTAKTYEDNRIKIFHKENGGLSDARNYGLKRAAGEYIYFMDSDDWIEPNLLEENIAILDTEKLDFVIFGYQQDNENLEGKVLNSLDFVPPNLKLRKGQDVLTVDQEILGLMGYAWNKIYKLDFLKKHELQFEKGTSLVEDILFNSQVYNLSNRLHFNNNAYYHYINRPVVTLIKQFHSNSFELKKNKTIALEEFLIGWSLKEEEIKRIQALSLIQGIRYCIHNLYSYKNSLSHTEKKAYLNYMLSDGLTREVINFYNPTNLKDKVYKFLLKHKLVGPLHNLSTLTK
ncbi:Glycosyltransferase involved in cell wall bisynthesis [Salegentibacter echinorum]|uniref:Glycosyltransferase involved in cell wall bisynthesis n=1 Tax=Salegentibacter echinorum TaxID=1073325 RepID=A0A1M5BVJ4_SALEC|nr:glycosyltransferase family 2 protein [Salegentibacter echinorum]SHF46252.1 Glycosyltransferase involved in cell wall bisynthesis [Salegentibacter echinorum]